MKRATATHRSSSVATMLMTWYFIRWLFFLCAVVLISLVRATVAANLKILFVGFLILWCVCVCESMSMSVNYYCTEVNVSISWLHILWLFYWSQWSNLLAINKMDLFFFFSSNAYHCLTFFVTINIKLWIHPSIQ